jgi:inhibitor of KinA
MARRAIPSGRMAAAPIKQSWASDSMLRLELGQEISPAIHLRVRAVYEELRSFHLPGVVDVVPAYATIGIAIDPLQFPPGAEQRVLEIAAAAAERQLPPGRLVEIPVCYEPPYALDLPEVATHTKLTELELIQRHSSAEYLVYFLGFSPGFPYMGGLPRSLAVPRLPRPRRQVPAGSVGIAGEQTGIYPQATPGGWRIIGRTPLALFDASREPPALLHMGDRVRFVRIRAAEFTCLAEGT